MATVPIQRQKDASGAYVPCWCTTASFNAPVRCRSSYHRMPAVVPVKAACV